MQPDASHADDVAEHADAKLRQKCFGERAHRDPGRGFARAGAFQDVAGVVEIVFDGARQVGMTGPRTRHRLLLVFRAIDVFHRKRFGPVFPIFVLDNDRDGRADGLRVADARNNFDLICFDLHAPAAAIALLPAPEFAIDGVERNGDPGGESGQGGDQALAMRFTGCFEAQHVPGKTSW